MKLFRGDNFQNSTEPGRYYFDGIRTKSFGQGFPRYIKPDALLTSIRQHINPVVPADFLVYDASEFLSFSKSEKRARYWLSDQSSIKLKKSTMPFEETRYLFQLEIDERDLKPIDKNETIFIFQYMCDPARKNANSSSIVEQLAFLAVRNGEHFRSCPICEGVQKKHQIVLVDAVKYLNQYGSDSSYEGSIINAENDKEWLVLPVEKISSFTGTTIPRADFWTVEHYIGTGEKREPKFHEIKGLMFDVDGSPI